MRALLLRCAGFNDLDLAAARLLGFCGRGAGLRPEAVAEHTLALVMAPIRPSHRAYNRAREGNFMLEGLLGVNLYGKTVGTGQIGLATGGRHPCGGAALKSRRLDHLGTDVYER